MSLRMLGLTSRVFLNTLNAAKPTVAQGCQRFTYSNFLTQKNQFDLVGKRCYSSFFSQSKTGDELRGSMYGVSSAGKKKGRGKRAGKKMGDLNRGQSIGSGRYNMLWPGLNTASTSKGLKVLPKTGHEDPRKKEELLKMRDQGRGKRPKITPLERGYTGASLPGQFIGPPDPVADYTFEGFDTVVLQFKTVCCMTGTVGRRMKFSAFVVTGNKNGIAGYGLGKSLNPKSAVRLAKRKASQSLLYIPRFENHTVYHDMYAKFFRSKVFIHKKEKGYGLRCHRILQSICKVVGIEDLRCKAEASVKNVQNLTKAFFSALIHQETHAELANRLGYHVVECKKEQDYRPKVMASPSVVKKEILVDEEEDLEADFQRLYFGGKCVLPKYPFYRSYMKGRPYLKSMRIRHTRRNQFQAAVMRNAGLA